MLVVIATAVVLVVVAIVGVVAADEVCSLVKKATVLLPFVDRWAHYVAVVCCVILPAATGM